jgi:type VI secretion system secreted protein VgrG
VENLEEEEEEEELQAGITLRLGLFFDGTGNNLANSEAAAGCYAVNLGMQPEMAEDIRQHCARFGYDGNGAVPDNSYGNDVTNVARLHELYPDQAAEHLSADVTQAYLKAYVEGIGTSSGEGDSIYGQGTGKGQTGVVARVEQVPALVLDKLRRFREANPLLEIGRIEIDLFGFSRGAAAARHCANDLLKGKDSLLAKALPAGSPLLTADFTWRYRSDFGLNFIGLFDTVAGIVSLRDGDFSPHNNHNHGLNLRLAPGIARKVVHLVARDEYRHNFSLNQAELDIELPGCHSDIGGGYLPLAMEKLLLSKPDTSFEFDPLPNERSDAYSRARQRFGHESSHWLSYVPPDGLSIATWSVVTQRRVRDTLAEKRVYAAIASQRQVRGELALVYLRIMREWGLRTGVPFKKLPDTPAFALPEELQPIAIKLQAFALGERYISLTAEEHALLRRRYIHLSANWNAAKGWNNSDLDVVFINRPAEGNQRVEHPNE